MKQSSVSQKRTPKTSSNSSPSQSTGPEGVFATPPAYGIGFIDDRSLQTETDAGASGAQILQRKADSGPAGKGAQAAPRNHTGLPDNLKSGIESLSGLAMDDVRVHYNSPRPAALQALAYTQGADIHVGPGQERHLPHEAWHVVQQKQARVKPTFQMKSLQINDDTGLEKEADQMGAKALRTNHPNPFLLEAVPNTGQSPIQRKLGFELEIPVTFLTDKKENVDTKMAYLDSKEFKVEGDKSHQAGQMKATVDEKEVTYSPTILEVVTHPIDEHAVDAEAKLQKVITAVEMFRFGLFLTTSDYTKPTTLGSLADSNLKLTQEAAKDYLVNYPTDTPRLASPESAYAHLTVGVSIDALQRAGEWVSNQGVKDYPGLQTHKEARDLLLSTDLFTQTIMHLEELPTKKSQDEVDNFLYLAFGHVRAIDRYENPDTNVKGGGASKNYTPLLSRASFANIFKNLSEDAQKYIVKYKKELKAILAKRLHAAGVDKKADGYLTDIFDQSIKTQREYFGGMVVKPVERTGPEGSGLVGPPVEIRSLGTALSEEGIRQKVGEVFVASRSQFNEKKPKSPFSLDFDYIFRK